MKSIAFAVCMLISFGLFAAASGSASQRMIDAYRKFPAYVTVGEYQKAVDLIDNDIPTATQTMPMHLCLRAAIAYDGVGSDAKAALFLRRLLSEAQMLDAKTFARLLFQTCRAVSDTKFRSRETQELAAKVNVEISARLAAK